MRIKITLIEGQLYLTVYTSYYSYTKKIPNDKWIEIGVNEVEDLP